MLELRSTRMLATLLCFPLILSQIEAAGETKHDKKYPPLRAPWEVEEALSPFGETLTPSQAILHWYGPKEATGYIVTIFLAENKELILHEEIKNIHKTHATFTDLESSTKYEVTVQAVRVYPDGTLQRSNYSKPYGFKTLDSCTGGRVHLGCTSACPKTCAKQVVSCDRRCIAACACPRGKPFLHNGVCLSIKQCRTAGTVVSEVLGRPQNLKIHRAKKSKGVLFQWDEVEGANFYTVIVSFSNGTIVRTIDTDVPFVLISNLKSSKVPYRFKVQAKWRRGRERILGFGPKLDPPSVRLVENTSIYIEWQKWEDVMKYQINLEDGDSKELIQSFKELNVSNNFVTIEGLMPATKYKIIVLITLDSLIGYLETLPAIIETRGIKNETVQENVIEYVMEPVIVTTTAAPTTTPPAITTCFNKRRALEAFYKSNPSTNMPECDSKGNYRARQCEKSGCYCVETVTGNMRPGSEFKNPSSEFALDCANYGKFKIPALDVTAFAMDTQTMKVKWQENDGCKFYIVKVHDGFEEGVIKSISGITKLSTVINGLEKGRSYVVTVAGVNSNGWTSTDKVRGQFVVMPHLDPPTFVRLAPVTEDRMKVMWTKSAAKYYKVEVYKVGEAEPRQTYENVTKNFVEFPVEGLDPYRVEVSSTGTRSIPGIDETFPVSSNALEAVRRPTCVPPPLDIIFVFDVSGKVSPTNFAKMKKFFEKLARGLTPIAKNMREKIGTRVAALKSYEFTRQIFRYDQFNKISGLSAALRYVQQTKSKKLNIGTAFNYIQRNFYSGNNKDDRRKNVKTAIVTFFGSASNDANFGGVASRLQSVTNVITVGVEGAIGKYDRTMASPDDQVALIPSYDDTDIAYEKVLKFLCSLKK